MTVKYQAYTVRRTERWQIIPLTAKPRVDTFTDLADATESFRYRAVAGDFFFHILEIDGVAIDAPSLEG